MSENLNEIIELKKQLISAGKKAVKELIKVAEEAIITNNEMEDSSGNEDADDEGSPKTFKMDLSADRLKNAAQAKRIAIEDGFAILQRCSDEEAMMSEDKGDSKVNDTTNFAERFPKNKF